MNDKILIRIVSTDVEENYDLFIPANEYIWKIKKLVIKSISDISQIVLDMNSNYVLINRDTLEVYDDNSIVINTDIRNGCELVLFNQHA